MELVLIRHAEPVRVSLVEGVADPPLHERGVEQASRLAAWLAGEQVDVLISSPLRRAVETAGAVARATGLEPAIDPGVAEWDSQSAEYIPIEELRTLKDDRWQAIVEGRYIEEPAERESFGERLLGSLASVIAAHAGQTVAVVCHGGVINHYVCDVLGMEPRLFFEPRYASITRVLASRDGVRSVRSLNETAHLRGLPGF